MEVNFTPIHNNASGLEGALEDEGVEDTYFRLIIESLTFDSMNHDERETLLLEIANRCTAWVLDRHNY